MLRPVVILIAMLIASPLAAQQTGQTVVVVRDTAIYHQGRLVGQLPAGRVVRVVKANANHVQVSPGGPGWLPRDAVRSVRQAIGHFSQAIEQTPEDTVAIAARGNLYLLDRQYPQAVEDYTEVIDRRPTSHQAHNQRGLAFSRMGRLSAALRDLNRAIRLKRNYGIAFYNRGHVHYQRAEYQRAIEDYNQALKWMPKDAASFNNRGLCRYARSEFELAIADFDRASELDPNSALAYNNRGWAWHRLGQGDAALADFNRARQLSRLAGSPSALPHQQTTVNLALRPIDSDLRRREALAARQRFENIWRELTQPPSKATPGDIAQQAADAPSSTDPSSVDQTVRDELLDTPGGRADPGFLASIGVFSAEEIERLSAPATDAPARPARSLNQMLSMLGKLDPQAIAHFSKLPLRGIYTLENETLRLRGFVTQGPLPRQLEPTPGERAVLLTLVRVGNGGLLNNGSDRDRLQGPWRVASAMHDGTVYPGILAHQIVIENDRVKVSAPAGGHAAFTLQLGLQGDLKHFTLSLVRARAAKTVVPGLASQDRKAEQVDIVLVPGAGRVVAKAISRPTRLSLSGHSLLLIVAVVGLLYFLIRYCGTQVLHGPGSGLKPSMIRRRVPPRAWHLLLVALLATVLAGGQRLAAFHWHMVPVVEALGDFVQIDFFMSPRGQTASWLLDLLMTVPVAFLWMGVAAIDVQGTARRAGRLVLLVAVAMAFRLVCEFMHTWLNVSTPARVDLLPELAGVLAGGLLWLAIGQSLVDWFRSMMIDRQPATRGQWLLLAYACGLVLLLIWPLDLSVRGADLARKYRDGNIRFVPLTEAALASKLIVNAVLLAPLGWLVARFATPSRQPVRSRESALVIGAVLVVAIESVQVLLLSSRATTTDLISGIVGIGIGVAFARRFTRQQPHRSMASRRGLRSYWAQVAPYMAFATLYVAVMAAMLCTPFEPISDQQLLNDRYLQIFAAPFAAVVLQPLNETISQGIATACWFAPLGVLWALAVAGPTIPRPVRSVLLGLGVLCGASLALAIEVVQVYLPSNIPGLTDVVAATIGTMLGVLATAGFFRYRLRARVSAH